MTFYKFVNFIQFYMNNIKKRVENKSINDKNKICKICKICEKTRLFAKFFTFFYID